MRGPHAIFGSYSGVGMVGNPAQRRWGAKLLGIRFGCRLSPQVRRPRRNPSRRPNAIPPWTAPSMKPPVVATSGPCLRGLLSSADTQADAIGARDLDETITSLTWGLASRRIDGAGLAARLRTFPSRADARCRGSWRRARSIPSDGSPLSRARCRRRNIH
jgi:hypothetical protein